MFNFYSLYDRWRFNNYTKEEFYIAKNLEKIRQTLFTFCTIPSLPSVTDAI